MCWCICTVEAEWSESGLFVGWKEWVVSVGYGFHVEAKCNTAIDNVERAESDSYLYGYEFGKPKLDAAIVIIWWVKRQFLSLWKRCLERPAVMKFLLIVSGPRAVRICVDPGFE